MTQGSPGRTGSSLLTGQEVMTVDPKSRLCIPAKFREGIGVEGTRGIVLHDHQELWIFPEREYLDLLVSARVAVDLEASETYLSGLLQGAEPLKLDTSGRIQLTRAFLVALKLDDNRNVIVAGSGNFLEVKAKRDSV